MQGGRKVPKDATVTISAAPAGQPGVLRTLDLYPLATTSGKDTKARTQTHNYSTTTGTAPAAQGTRSVPRMPAVGHDASPARASSVTSGSTDNVALPDIDTYLSSQQQLNQRVATELTGRLAAVLHARLQARMRAAAEQEVERRAGLPPQASRSTQAAAAAAEWEAAPATAPKEVPPTSSYTVPAAAATRSTASEAAEGGNLTDGVFTCTSRPPRPSASVTATQTSPAPPPPRAVAVSAREGPRRRKAADSGDCLVVTPMDTPGRWDPGEPPVEEEEPRPDYSAIDLVRVVRLRAVPKHNRGVYAWQVVRPFTTRSGNMIVGGRSPSGRRVRPGAWGALYERRDQSAGSREGYTDRSRRHDPITGLAGTGWVAQYQAEQARRGGPSSDGGTIVMRTFDTDGLTFFQWGRGATGVEGVGSGAGGFDATLLSAMGRGGRLEFADSEEDIDKIIDHVVAQRYGRPLTKEERARAKEMLRAHRKAAMESTVGAGHDGAYGGTGAAGSVIPVGRRSAREGSFRSGGSSLYSASGRPESGFFGGTMRSDGATPDGHGPNWGHFAIPGADDGNVHSWRTGNSAGSPMSRHGVSSTHMPGFGSGTGYSVPPPDVDSSTSYGSGHRAFGRGDRGTSAGSSAGGRRPIDGSAHTLEFADQDPLGQTSGSHVHSRPTSSSRQRVGVVVVIDGEGTASQPGSGSGASPIIGELRGLDSSSEAGAANSSSRGSTAGSRGAGGMNSASSEGGGSGRLGSSQRKGKRARRMRRRADGTLEPCSDNGEDDDDKRLDMFLAHFPESQEHVRLRRQANNILAGLEGFGDDDGGLSMPDFDDSRDLWGHSMTSAGESPKGPRKKRKDSETPVRGFSLNEDNLREKFRKEALVHHADLVAVRDSLKKEVAYQNALREAFTTDIHNLSSNKTGSRFAVELTREVNQFAKEHHLSLRQILQNDALMEDDIEEVAEGFLNRFWKGKADTTEVACQVTDEDLGYVDEGVRSVEAHMQDLYYHEHGLLTAIRLATVAVANMMSFHSSLELESTCRECFFLFDRPRTLWPCGHTFCQQCLAGMYNKRDELICGECGSVCEVGYTPNLSLELIANYQLVQGVESPSKEKESGNSASPTQTIESVLRNLLSDLAATQRSCSSQGMNSMNGMLPVSRVQA